MQINLQWELLAQTGWNFGTEKFRDKLMKELSANKNGKITHPYAILEKWKSAGWETLTENSCIGMEYLNKKYNAYVFLRRSGTKYYEYRKKLENDYTEGHDNYADDVTETYNQVAHLIPNPIQSRSSGWQCPS